MPQIRVTFMFQQKGDGFSESWWLPKVASDLSSYQTIADRLAQKRIALCGRQTSCIGFRISEDGVFRDGYTYHYPATDIPGTQGLGPITLPGLQGSTIANSDNDKTCLINRARNADYTRWKTTFMRGIWDEVVQYGGLYRPITVNEVSFTALLQAWSRQLVNDGWGWMGTGTRTVQNVTTVTQNANGTVQITFAGNLFPAISGPNYQIRVSGVQGATEINGQLLVVATSLTSCYTVRRITISTYTTGGKGTYAPRNTFIPVAAATEITGVSERRTGRAFFVSPGRRRARRAG